MGGWVFPRFRGPPVSAGPPIFPLPQLTTTGRLSGLARSTPPVYVSAARTWPWSLESGQAHHPPLVEQAARSAARRRSDQGPVASGGGETRAPGGEGSSVAEAVATGINRWAYHQSRWAYHRSTPANAFVCLDRHDDARAEFTYGGPINSVADFFFAGIGWGEGLHFVLHLVCGGSRPGAHRCWSLRFQ